MYVSTVATAYVKSIYNESSTVVCVCSSKVISSTVVIYMRMTNEYENSYYLRAVEYFNFV